jgi:DNA-binding NtrC family response regulator
MGASTKKILLIDDDELFVTILEMSLRQEGYDVVSCYRGGEGLVLFKNIKPDLVLLDIRLPDLDGYEVMRQIKAMDPEAKIIITTAYQAESDSDEATKQNATSFYEKSLSVEKLFIMIRSALQ